MEFEIIYRKYFKDVLLYVCGLAGDAALAEEIAQETFTKALKSLESYKAEKDIRAWLFAIAKNSYFSHCRKQKLSVSFPEEDVIQDTGISFTEAIENSETTMQIHAFLHSMEEPYKEVFMLRVMGDLPYDKIGAIFGKSSGWARVTSQFAGDTYDGAYLFSEPVDFEADGTEKVIVAMYYDQSLYSKFIDPIVNPDKEVDTFCLNDGYGTTVNGKEVHVDEELVAFYYSPEKIDIMSMTEDSVSWTENLDKMVQLWPE